ncbi:hypothetical protein B4079_5050 [Bacillus cereus]|nr:hypothetical protein B4079_5050 [Bacillus cereus]
MEWNYHFIILILLVIVTIKSLLCVKSFEYEKVVMELY